jgi:PAS domain S-box-containing protein/putative nucleotidyltransferase with HDIG domain
MKKKYSSIDELLEGALDENACGQTCNLNAINKLSAKLVQSLPENEIYQTLGQYLQEMIPESIIVINSFNRETYQFTIKTILGDYKKINSIERILGRSPAGLPLTINETALRGLNTGMLQRVPGGLFELTMGCIPEESCDAISRIISIRDIFAIGFAWRGELYGSACIVLESDSKTINKGIVETAVHITSVALQRYYADEALSNSERKRNDSLARLVEQRTAELKKANKTLREELEEKKKTEETARHTAARLERLMEDAPIYIAEVDFNNRVTYINRKLEEATGFTKEYAIGKSWITEGIFAPQFIEQMLKRLKERLLGRPPTGMELPLKCKDGQIKYISGVGHFIMENGFPVGIQVLGQDITRLKQAEEKAEKNIKHLMKALEDMINAMVITMELKDPYTANHQRRVAELAHAIATDIGLDEDKLLGIKLAGLVHDIGKIRVPSEILTYPGKLNEAEKNIMEMHPAVGHEILKNIDFNWPIADVVLQHHERINGSGYPAGLTGKDILIEARILAVADVVEAMSSHRPYRPALGLDAALKEITKNSDVLYDEKIVNSCLKLFQNKNFSFKS